MTLYDGTLFDLIQSRNHKPFSEKEIVCISCQLLEALATLHSKRLIHRDVKSMNIYYEEGDDKTFVMGDFGESKIIFTTTGSLIRKITSEDPELKEYSCIIIDEAHERNIQIDLLLKLLKEINAAI